MRVLRALIGILLLPVCFAVTRTALALLGTFQPAGLDSIPPAGLAMLVGFAGWMSIYLALPRPMRVYVLAHELTHALWGWLYGARVSGLRVGRSGGSVSVSNPNFVIVLAPYFFPLYTILLVIAYGVCALFWNLHPYYLLWLGLVGFTWGFHVAFTVSTLGQRQTDIERCGYVISYALI